MPAIGKKAAGPKGCWLDALKAKVAPKRKAPPGAAAAKNNKRPATEAADASGDTPAGAADGGGGGADEGSQGGAAASYDVLYKFNEGYTNAVKRPMKVFEMLQ
jgi:chromosome transmission fidelity protein 18